MANAQDIAGVTSNAQSKTRHLVLFVLLIPLSWWVADTFWLLFQGAEPPARLSDSLPVIGIQNQQQPGLSEERIARWKLFGEEGEAPAATSALEDVPDTSLNLELLGIFQTADTAAAGAIIAQRGKEAELYRTGDRLPGNASLETILEDRVILKRRGQRETLRLAEIALGAMAFEHVPSSQTKEINHAGRPGQEPDESKVQGVRNAPEDMAEQRIQLIGQLGLEPVAAGSPQGYLIGDGAPPAITSAGLQKGDIVLSLNGITLGTEENDLMALESYKESGEALVQIQRDQQTFTVNLAP